MKVDSRRGAAALLLAVLLALVVTDCTAHGTDPVPTPADSLAARSQEVLDQAVVAGAPGCSAAVGEHGKVLWQGVRGMADLESRTPISPDTLFDVGSVSKQFTATAVVLRCLRHASNRLVVREEQPHG